MKKTATVKALNAEELSYFCTQLALILKSGVTLRDGLCILLDDTIDERAVSLLSQLSTVIDDEKPLYIAMESTGSFSPYFINMVKIGEITGRLDDVLESLATYYDREANLKVSLKGAIMHPLILLLMMSAVVGILILKVIPIFNQVFVQLGAQMHATASATIEFASTTGIIIISLIGALVVIFSVLAVLSINPTGKSFVFKLLSNFTAFRNLLEKVSLSRFCAAMSLMLSSGVETSEALELGAGVLNYKPTSEKVLKCYEKVKHHEPFAQAVTEVGIFPPLYSQMIKISYKSGALDAVWKKISNRYDEDVTDSLNSLVSIIEPLLVGVLSIIIGVILISVMLPLMGVMSSLS